MKTNSFKEIGVNRDFNLNSIVLVILSLFLLSCSSDDSEEVVDTTPAFSFKIKGDGIDKTIAGNGIVFQQTTTDGVTFEGDDTKLTSILIIAQVNKLEADEVAFAVTQEGTDIGTGNYAIGFDLASFYNAFLNYSIIGKEGIDYKASGGTISLSNKTSGFVNGSINISCVSTGEGGTLNISGTFTAPAKS